jgi:hypothetical protein
MAEEPKQDKLPETDNKNEIAELRREVELLRNLYYTDNFTSKQIFRKKIEFKQPVDLTIGTVADITKIIATGGTAPKADGTYTFDKTTDTTLAITIKNGIITGLAIS